MCVGFGFTSNVMDLCAECVRGAHNNAPQKPSIKFSSHLDDYYALM